MRSWWVTTRNMRNQVGRDADVLMGLMGKDTRQAFLDQVPAMLLPPMETA